MSTLKDQVTVTEPQTPPQERDTRRRRGAGTRSLRSRDPIFQPLPGWVWLTSAAIALGGFFTANPLLTPFSVMLVPTFASLLWFRGEPPVLLFACLMQWLQAGIAVFYTDLYGVSLESASGGPYLARAAKLS